MQVQGQHPHQRAPFQVAGLLHAWQIWHQLSRVSIMRVDNWELTLCDPSLSAASMSFWASQVHAFHQLVCHRLSWLHPWIVPHVHTSRAFSPSGWGLDPQCQAVQVTHWTRWWQCLAAWHCRSVWSLPCHSTADIGSLALSMAKSHWHGALCFAHKSYTCDHVSWKRGGWKRTGSSSLNFFQVVFMCCGWKFIATGCWEHVSLGSKRKLLPPACQVLLGLPSVVCRPRDVQFPGTLYICNQGPLSSAWAHCILVHPMLAAIAKDTSHSNMTTPARKLTWTLQEVQARTTDHDLCLSCIYSQPFLLHCFFPSQEPPDISQQFSDDKVHN